MSDPDRVVAIAAQIACRLLGDVEPSDLEAHDEIIRQAVRLARLLMQEVANTEEKPRPLREVERS